MAVLHCLKCNRELWFTPTRRRRRQFWFRCACGIVFTPKETGRVRRSHKPKPGATVVDPQHRRTIRFKGIRGGTHAS